MSINELRSITTFVRASGGKPEQEPRQRSTFSRAREQGAGTTGTVSGRAPVPPHHAQHVPNREGERFLEAARPSLIGLQWALQGARHTREDIAGPLRIVGPRTVFLAGHPGRYWTNTAGSIRKCSPRRATRRSYRELG